MIDIDVAQVAEAYSLSDEILDLMENRSVGYSVVCASLWAVLAAIFHRKDPDPTPCIDRESLVCVVSDAIAESTESQDGAEESDGDW